MIGDPYGDDELAALYDLGHADYDADLSMYEQFARRGETPVLELGAGTGRVALHLARAGIGVVALEPSPAMRRRLCARLVDEDGDVAKRVQAVEGDMRSFDLGGRFDLVVAALCSFEHLLTLEDACAALGCVERHLAPGGLFVAELRAPAAVDWSPEPSAATIEWARVDPHTGDVVTRTASTRASQATQTTTHTMVFDRAPAAGGPVHRRISEVTLRAYTPGELRLLLEAAGLRLHNLYGDHDLSPFDDASDTMIAVAARA